MKRERSTPAAARVADGLLASRRALPIWSAQQELLREVASSPTLILTGDTGCGKTTQIPQFLHGAGYSARGIIGITQPRRVAAMSVAQRVAAEMGTQVGELVGYCVRFDDRSGPRTRIRYVTDGMLLREAMGDPLLSRYSVLIVDEAHERSLQTDVVLAILKAAQAARGLKAEPKPAEAEAEAGAEPPTVTAEPGATSITPRAKGAARRAAPPLKLLVMSATLELEVLCGHCPHPEPGPEPDPYPNPDPDPNPDPNPNPDPDQVFCGYFGGAPAVQVLGRAYPVQLMYAPEPQPDYVEAAVTTVLQLHMDAAPGDVLVFLTGQAGPAILAMALLTMALLTMALLTMALLTMANLQLGAQRCDRLAVAWLGLGLGLGLGTRLGIGIRIGLWF